MPNIVKYDQAQNIIKDVAAECGLGVIQNDPYVSLDGNVQRLCSILKSAGRELLGMYQWQDKLIVYNLTTVLGDTGVYSLPIDFDTFIDQTGWQKSYFWPLRGPYSAQMWQRVVNYPTTGIYVAFRIQNDQLWLWPQPPPIGIGITFMYKTRGWVTDATTGQLKDAPTVGIDVVNYDSLLIMKFLKLRFLEAIGHDTTDAKEQFKVVFDMKTSQNEAAAPELELAKDARYPFITGFNSPDTGFGGQPPAGGSYQ